MYIAHDQLILRTSLKGIGSAIGENKDSITFKPKSEYRRIVFYNLVLEKVFLLNNF